MYRDDDTKTNHRISSVDTQDPKEMAKAILKGIKTGPGSMETERSATFVAMYKAYVDRHYRDLRYSIIHSIEAQCDVDEAKMSKDAITEDTLLSHIEDIKKLEQVEDVGVKGSVLAVRTKHIDFRCGPDEYIGDKYQILIDLSKGTVFVYAYNRPTKDLNYGPYQHPHIWPWGGICFGNLSQHIYQALAKGNLLESVSLMLALLAEVTYESTYLRIIRLYGWKRKGGENGGGEETGQEDDEDDFEEDQEQDF